MASRTRPAAYTADISSIAKFLTEDNVAELTKRLSLSAGHAVFFGAGEFNEVSKITSGAGGGRALGGFCWIVDFPMHERDEETGKIDFSHNPFLMPQGRLQALKNQDPWTSWAGRTSSAMGRVPGRGVADHGPSLPLWSRPVRAAASRRAITAGPGPAIINRASGEGDSGFDLGIPSA